MDWTFWIGEMVLAVDLARAKMGWNGLRWEMFLYLYTEWIKK